MLAHLTCPPATCSGGRDGKEGKDEDGKDRKKNEHRAALRERAAAELRSLSAYVSLLVLEDLKRKTPRRRAETQAKPGDKRAPREIRLQLRPAERRKLEARARAEMRSLSSYVATLILRDLAR